MKGKIFLLSAIAALVLSACQFESKQQTESGQQENTAEERTGLSDSLVHPEKYDPGNGLAGSTSRPGVDREAVLMEETATVQFDGQEGEEVFRVSLLGDSILSGTVAFTITNGKGELIYSDEFPAIMLAATYDESVNTPAKQEALVKKRIEEFFMEERFKEPAIQGDQPPHDSYFIDKATYDNLRVTDAPGFLYLIGKENTKHIAWSPLEQKVLMYFNCC